MTEYTPVTPVVRGAYVNLMKGWVGKEYVAEQHAHAEFDRWLDQTLREAKAEAWGEGYMKAVANGSDHWGALESNPYRQERTDD